MPLLAPVIMITFPEMLLFMLYFFIVAKLPQKLRSGVAKPRERVAKMSRPAAAFRRILADAWIPGPRQTGVGSDYSA
jgi:hypothetical protein